MCQAKGTAIPTVQIDDGNIRVTKWHFPTKGANTGWHKHAHDYVVVPLFDGVLEIADAQGNISHSVMENGGSYARLAGVEHDVINGNEDAVSFVEIEFLNTGLTADGK